MLAKGGDEEVVGNTNVEAGGKFHLAGTVLGSHGVLSFVHELERKTSAFITVGRTPVLQADTEFEFVVGTSYILNTGIDGESTTGYVIGRFVDDFDVDTALDGQGEGMGISHIDVHQSGRECTIDGFGAFDCGDVDITYTERHDTQAKDATVEKADSKTDNKSGASSQESKSGASSVQSQQNGNAGGAAQQDGGSEQTEEKQESGQEQKQESKQEQKQESGQGSKQESPQETIPGFTADEYELPFIPA